MPPAARVADPTAHPGVVTGPGVATVLIVGMPAAVVGDIHTCSFPAARLHPADAVPDGQHDGHDRRPPGAADGRHGGLRRPDRDGRPDRDHRRMSDEPNWFVGSGIAYPMRIGPSGGIALVSRDEEIAESMRLILGTSPGERPMRPDFGCPIHEHIFAPTDATTAGLIGFEVRNALRRWEPRIEVHDVEVTPADDQPSLLYIDISYEIRTTNDRRNLVFPFYVIPDEE